MKEAAKSVGGPVPTILEERGSSQSLQVSDWEMLEMWMCGFKNSYPLSNFAIFFGEIIIVYYATHHTNLACSYHRMKK